MKPEEIKEETIASMLQRNKEELVQIFMITEDILTMLRGVKSEEKSESVKEDCLFDTCYINSNYICLIKNNLNNIFKKLGG